MAALGAPGLSQAPCLVARCSSAFLACSPLACGFPAGRDAVRLRLAPALSTGLHTLGVPQHALDRVMAECYQGSSFSSLKHQTSRTSSETGPSEPWGLAVIVPSAGSPRSSGTLHKPQPGPPTLLLPRPPLSHYTPATPTLPVCGGTCPRAVAAFQNASSPCPFACFGQFPC